MDLLLDTHTLIWFMEDNPNLSAEVASLISNQNNQCYISIASLWEISIKASIGKIKIAILPSAFEPFLKQLNFELIQVQFAHLKILESLPLYHRDPFDRLLISQAIQHDLAVLTKDSYFKEYTIKTIW